MNFRAHIPTSRLCSSGRDTRYSCVKSCYFGHQPWDIDTAFPTLLQYLRPLTSFESSRSHAPNGDSIATSSLSLDNCNTGILIVIGKLIATHEQWIATMMGREHELYSASRDAKCSREFASIDHKHDVILYNACVQPIFVESRSLLRESGRGKTR